MPPSTLRLLNNYADVHESVPENRMTNETNHDKGEEGAILSEVGGSEDERHQNVGGGDDQAGMDSANITWRA